MPPTGSVGGSISGFGPRSLVPRAQDSFMRTELTSIPTDTLPLDGAFYEPDGGATAGGVLLFHGNTMNFYVGAPRFLPPARTALGLAFNRRGQVYEKRSNRNVKRKDPDSPPASKPLRCRPAVSRAVADHQASPGVFHRFAIELRMRQ